MGYRRAKKVDKNKSNVNLSFYTPQMELEKGGQGLAKSKTQDHRVSSPEPQLDSMYKRTTLNLFKENQNKLDLWRNHDKRTKSQIKFHSDM